MAEHRERYLLSSADGHFPSTCFPKICLLLKSHSQKRKKKWIQGSNSDLFGP